MVDTGVKTLATHFGNQILDGQIVIELVELRNLYPNSSEGKAGRQLNLCHRTPKRAQKFVVPGTSVIRGKKFLKLGGLVKSQPRTLIDLQISSPTLHNKIIFFPYPDRRLEI